jgi:hypothetical protein
MKVCILTSAFNDLGAGREFYDRQGEGMGDYFFDSVFADIDSLALYGGIHLKVLAITAAWPPVFRMRSTTGWEMTNRSSFIGCWIADKTRPKSRGL